MENNKSQLVYDDLKLNGNKALYGLKNIKSLLDQIGLRKLWIKADYSVYMDVGIFNITRQRLEIHLIKNVFKFK